MREFHFEDLLIGWNLLAEGFVITLLISSVVIAISLIAGTLLGVARQEGSAWIRRPAGLYIDFIRSIPLVLFLVFVHYGLMFSINTALNRDLNFLESAIVALSLFEAAYIAEVIRGGLRSIQTTERDAAKSLGLNVFQRLVYVFLPLAYRRSIPNLLNQFVSLIKDTSLTSIIGVHELTRQGEILYQNTFHDFEVLVFLAFVYFVICFTLSRLSRRFEYGSQEVQNMAILQA